MRGQIESQPTRQFHSSMNLAILGIAHHKLDQPYKENSSLEKASKLITTLNKDLSKKDAPDLRLVEILFREANGKIKHSQARLHIVNIHGLSNSSCLRSGAVAIRSAAQRWTPFP